MVDALSLIHPTEKWYIYNFNIPNLSGYRFISMRSIRTRMMGTLRFGVFAYLPIMLNFQQKK